MNTKCFLRCLFYYVKEDFNMQKETRPFIPWELVDDFMTAVFVKLGLPEEDARPVSYTHLILCMFLLLCL